MKIGTDNLLHVEFTFYGKFKLETKNSLIGTTFTCMFFLMKHGDLMHMEFQMSFKWWVKLKPWLCNHWHSKPDCKIHWNISPSLQGC